MDFLDKLSKTVSQGIDRARFEADKFQKTSRIQGELNDLKKTLDSRMIELGYRAYDLFRAGKITSPSVAELARAIDEIRSELVVKEEELKEAQDWIYIEPEDQSETPAAPPPVQNIPVERESSPPAPVPPPPHESSAPSYSHAQPRTKVCPACGFEMPGRARFCPRCGHHVGSQ
jgi:hypothetical protein